MASPYKASIIPVNDPWSLPSSKVIVCYESQKAQAYTLILGTVQNEKVSLSHYTGYGVDNIPGHYHRDRSL